MRWRILAGMVTAAVLLLCGCGENWDKDRILDRWDHITETLAASQFTDEEDLIGVRVWEDGQHYTGVYAAACEDETGRDVIFGGASIYQRQIRLLVSATPESGTATLRIRQNTEVTEYPLTDEAMELDLTLQSGGTYIMVDYERYTGTAVLSSVFQKLP